MLVHTSVFHELVFMLDEIVHSLLSHIERREHFFLELAQQLDKVLDLSFDSGEHGAIADRTVGAERHQIVRKPRRCKPEVRSRLVFPLLAEVDTGATDHREARSQ